MEDIGTITLEEQDLPEIDNTTHTHVHIPKHFTIYIYISNNTISAYRLSKCLLRLLQIERTSSFTTK